MLDVAKLVRQDAGQLFIIDTFQQSTRDAKRTMFGIAASREGIRLVIVDDVKLGHWKARLACEPSNDMNQRRRAGRFDGVCAVHGQQDFVRIPVSKKVRPGGEQEGDRRASWAPDQITDYEKKASQRGQQQSGPENVHGNSSALCTIGARRSCMDKGGRVKQTWLKGAVADGN